MVVAIGVSYWWSGPAGAGATRPARFIGWSGKRQLGRIVLIDRSANPRQQPADFIDQRGGGRLERLGHDQILNRTRLAAASRVEVELRASLADARTRLDRAEARLAAPWWQRLLGRYPAQV
jgi:hypothetical protein